jgi:hypothetical protein
MLDDIEYRGKSPDIPEQERTVFLSLWPNQREALAHGVRQVISASRDVVRSIDEVADYITFSTPRRGPDGAAGASPTPPAQDSQLEEIRDRALKAIRRLQSSFDALSPKVSPEAGGANQ